MKTTRRQFLTSVSMLAAGTVLPASAFAFGKGEEKLKIVLVGTGIRGNSFWAKRIIENYGDIVDYVGLCDINPGRLAYAKEYIGATCPTFTDFDKMMDEVKPEVVIVTTKDSNHHEFIINGLNRGCDVITEKPMTIDEDKCQAILDAERKSEGKLVVGFNYRWSPYATKVKELLRDGAIGDVVSVDFNYYLNTSHGASYFRRWHGLKDEGGTLYLHKATHHFDLLNWWIDSDPKEVFAYSDLEFYGENGPFRGENCRVCEHKEKCDFHWDITKKKSHMKLYVENEKYDGYIRDNCLFRKEIDIYDKMSAQIKYANNVVVNYSLTTYSPFEGYRVSFNGTKGRLEAWHHIPYNENIALDQEKMHEQEMDQDSDALERAPIIVHELFNKDYKKEMVEFEKSGHGGGDKRLHDKIFVTPGEKDPFDRAAGSRDGAMSILIGIAARKSTETGKPIKITDLTDLKPEKKRIV